MSQIENLSFDLPNSLIAKYPSQKRDESKLMLVNKNTGEISIEPYFKNIVGFLKQGDLLIYNQTKVSKRRFYLKSQKGRIHECIFLEKEEYSKSSELWKCILAKSKKLKVGDVLHHGKTKFIYQGNTQTYALIESTNPLDEDFFEKNGNIPIPPYLKRKAEESDNTRYQTIFASSIGSVAAPTAALHFTEQLKGELLSKGVQFLPVDLTVGYGTFSKVTEKQLQEKKLHSEKYSLTKHTSETLNQQKIKQKRIISIGTTSLRVLETCYNSKEEMFCPRDGATEIFITPDDKIQTINGLITNFHLPNSSLLMLVSAFASVELIVEAYNKAIENNMRFYSYGDAMFIYEE